MASEERDRGMLGTEDREFLAGEKEYQTDQGEYDRKATIRQRLFDGILDFGIVHSKLSEWNWQRFTNLEPKEIIGLRDGMVSAIALFYQLHHALNLDFEETVRRGIEHSYEGSGTSREMQRKVVDNVELTVETSQPYSIREVHDRIERKLKNGRDLTDREIRIGIQGDLETRDRVITHARERTDGPSKKYEHWARHHEARYSEGLNSEE